MHVTLFILHLHVYYNICSKQRNISLFNKILEYNMIEAHLGSLQSALAGPQLRTTDTFQRKTETGLIL